MNIVENFYYVFRDCSTSNCPHFTSDRDGNNWRCKLTSNHRCHPYDGRTIEGCPVEPYVELVATDMNSREKRRWINEELKKKRHVFDNLEEAQASVGETR